MWRFLRMKWSKLKEETIENIKAFSISGILVVAFYTLINNVEPLYGVFQAIFVALSPSLSVTVKVME